MTQAKRIQATFDVASIQPAHQRFIYGRRGNGRRARAKYATTDCHAPPGIFEDIGAGNKELFSYQLSYKRRPFHPRAPGSLAQQALFISSESHG